MEKKLTAIIVDDESLARESLKNALKPHAGIEIVAESINGFAAIQDIQRFHPDIVFLDIQMPKLDGFDVVELLGKEAPIIIFVTSYDEYALKAFEAQALDYLLKPVNPNRLALTIDRIRELVRQSQKQPYEVLVEKHRQSTGLLSRVLIRNGSDVIIIPVNDISHLEARGDYVRIHTQDGKTYLKSSRMNTLETMLEPGQFCRIHRSYIINLDCLKKIEPYTKDSRLAILMNGVRVPISRSGYSQLLKLI